MENKIKLLVISHMRWGKDTFAEILYKNFGLTYQSSSQAAADIFIYDELKDKYGYKTPEECFEDRMNRRSEWYDLICQYNIEDKARLAKDILKRTDVYVGMRDHREITECINQGIFDLIIWVDASKRLPEEPKTSFNIDIGCADIIVDNNDTLVDFEKRVIRLGKALKLDI
jgi:dephospho-CoA kinase